jgi:hypothetical protein
MTPVEPRAIALHIFRPADNALVGGDLQKRIDPPTRIAMQVFDLDDLDRSRRMSGIFTGVDARSSAVDQVFRGQQTFAREEGVGIFYTLE